MCSHGRVLHIFDEVLYSPKSFYGHQCNSLDDAIRQDCKGVPGAFINDKENEMKNLSGIFHVSTYRSPPFGHGLKNVGNE